MKFFRITELIILYAFAPLVLGLSFFPRPWIIYLYGAAVLIMLWLRFARKRSWRDLWSGTHSGPSHLEIAMILSRFGINAILLVVLAFVISPGSVLGFPAVYPFQWLAVMILYPLVMVYPQELFFRQFFVERYGSVLGTGWRMLVVNAVLFGWAHLLYGSWISVALSALGGLLFMDTYRRTRSMKYVWLEHALYGDLIFTIGLGQYFYSGWAG